MKRFSMLAAFLLLCSLFAAAQPSLGPVRTQNYQPTGACSLPNQLVIVTVGTGAGQYQCVNSGWVRTAFVYGTITPGHCTYFYSATQIADAGAACGAGGGMVYPGAGIPYTSNGTAWGTSLTKFGTAVGLATSTDPGAVAEVPMVADGTHGQKPSASGALGTAAFTAASAYDAAGAAAARAGVGTCTSPNFVQAAGTGGVTCATPAGSGTVTHTAGNLTLNALMLGNGVADSKVDSGCSTDGAGALSCTTVAVSTTVYTNVEYNNGTCTTSTTITPVNGNEQLITLTNAQACALTFTAPVSGSVTIALRIKQSTAGSFNGTITTSGVLWPTATVPTITATSGAEDWIICKYRAGGATYRCIGSQDFR